MRYILLVAALVAAALGYTVYWNHLAARYADGTRDWIAERQKEGYAVSTGGYRVSGFPDQIVLTVDAPHIAKPDDPLAWSVSGQRLTLYAQPWNFSHFILDLGKSGSVEWKDGDRRHTAQIEASDAKASFVLDGGGKLGRFDSVFRDALLKSSALAGPVRAARLELHERNDPKPEGATSKSGIDLAVVASQVTLPPDPALALGNTLSSVDALVSVPAPFPDGLAGIPAWRDAGGTLELTALKLRWGPLDLRGNGTLTLDKQMRPLAALATEIRGFGPSLDALGESGRMQRGDARLAKTALGLLAKTDNQGDRVLKVPLTAQDGRLFVGPVGLFRLSPLPFPPQQLPQPPLRPAQSPAG